jgi:radical SAM superfamily enzyme YgiQ (UPF0313 family)
MAQILIFTGIIRSSIRPIGAYQLASILRSNGYSVQVIDFFPDILKKGVHVVHEIIKKYVNKDTIWVGFSSTFLYDILGNRKSGAIFTADEFLSIRNSVREINQETKFVLGGGKSLYRDPSNVIIRNDIKNKLGKEKISCSDYFDCYIEGYSDSSVVKYTMFCQKNNPFLSYQKNDDGSISIVNDHKAISFDFSNYNFNWHNDDYIFKNEALPIEISRGCIFKCSFCSFPLNGKKKLDYLKSPEILIDHFLNNYEKYGTTDYIYMDDTHNDSVDKLEILYEKVYSKLPFKIKFGTYLRLDLLAAHPHTIDLLKESGIDAAFFGIESLNYPSAKSIGKGIKPEKIIETLDKIRNAWPEATLQAGFIIGLPYETEKTARNWLDIISKKNFPLDSINLETLRLHPNRDRLWVSDMDENLDKYNYTFDTNSIWTNNVGLSQTIAKELQKEYFDRYMSNNRIKVGWTGLFSLINLGIPRNIAKQCSEYRPDEYIPLIKRNFVNEYLKKIL